MDVIKKVIGYIVVEAMLSAIAVGMVIAMATCY